MWSEIKSIYRDRGDERYMIGEPITQIQHAIQTSLQIKQMGGNESLQVAGLLHDIGHLVQTYISPSDNVDDMHENIGTEWLKTAGFGPDVYEPARLHVKAKKYMCLRDDDYIQKLSPASRHTLTLQGGIMSEKEADDFENEKYFDDAILVRKGDDLGKNINLDSIPNFDSFKSLVKRVHHHYDLVCRLDELRKGRVDWKILDRILNKIHISNDDIKHSIENARTFSKLFQSNTKRKTNRKRVDDAEIFSHVLSRLIKVLLKA